MHCGLRYVLTVAPVLCLAGCGGGEDSAAPPATGTLEITTSTSGAELDPDGYIFQIDGGPNNPIGSSATVRSDHPTGPHSIQLAGVAANCTVADNPRSVTVVGGDTTAASFAITCVSTTGTGSLTVTAATSGLSPDADGYLVTVDGADGGALPAGGSLTLANLPAGTHSVGLSGIAGNCQLQGDNPRPASITTGQTASLSFSIVCTAPPLNAGTLQVVTATSGPSPDPDGYTLAVDGGTAQVIGLNATVTIPNVPAGLHQATLAGLASNCVASGANPRTATVQAGATARVEFQVTCRTPALVWRRMETGTSYNLQGIWGSSASDLFTVGETAGGSPTSGVLHFDGQRWTEQLTVANQRLQSTWGSGPTDVFAVGFNAIGAGPGSLIYHYSGSSWTQMADPPLVEPMYHGVWGASGSNVFAVGEYFDGRNFGLISHFDGSSWTQVPFDQASDAVTTDVYGTSASNVYVSGHTVPAEGGYFVLHYDGSSWTQTRFPEEGVLWGVWASSPNDVFAVGIDVNGGFIIHYDGRLWSRMVVPPTPNPLADIWGSSGSDVYAVGDGTILHYDGTRWTQVSQEGGQDVFGFSATDVYVAGNGVVLHGTPYGLDS
jgi:hypothetical protein